MIESILRWSAEKWLTKLVNKGISALQKKTDIPALVIRVRRYQDNIRRWYFAVDNLLAKVLKKAENGNFDADEIVELKDDGMAFVLDLTREN